MIYGISGAPVPAHYGDASKVFNASAIPLLCAAIGQRESNALTNFIPWILEFGANPDTGLMPDGSNAGHGIMQLTDAWPSDWDDPFANVTYAFTNFISPALAFWNGQMGYEGSALVRLVAGSYNAGLSAARKAHAAGDVDLATTNHDYATTVLKYYLALLVDGPLS